MSASDKSNPDRLRFRLWRIRLRNLRPKRLIIGGRIDDLGRLPRYFLLTLIVMGALWGSIYSYLRFTPPSFRSEVSLILPGSGASNTITLDDIGQASSHANSAFESNAISPTQTYKRLLSANRVLAGAAAALQVDIGAFGRPKIKLVDETSLIHFEMKGASAEEAQAKAAALLQSFQQALILLRDDDLAFRQDTATSANQEYADAVSNLRQDITEIQRLSGLLSFAQYQQLVADGDMLQARIREAEAALRHSEDAVASLTARLGVGVDIAALNLKLHANANFQGLAQAVSEQAALLAVARGQYGDRHPLVQDALAAHSGAMQALLFDAAAVTGMSEDALAADIRVLLDTDNSGLFVDLVQLNVERQAQQAEVQSYRDALQRLQDRLADQAPFAAMLDDLERDYQVAEAVFASAMARSQTNKADLYASYPLVQVLEDASLPLGPSSPNVMIALAAGIGASMMFFVAMILAWVRRPIIAKILNTRALE